MPTPDGYVLSKKDLILLRQFLHKFKRLQHFTNPFGRPPDNTIDNEEMPSTDMYIARTPDTGIPGLTSAGSTGIGDTPGKATCTIFKIDGNTELTDDVTDYTQVIYNLNATPMDADAWILTMRDKYGSWYALQTIQPTGIVTTGHARGPGWTAGLSDEDCLELTVVSKTGKCLTIPDQTIILEAIDGITWNGLSLFTYSTGTGTVVFTRPDGSSLPTLKIDGQNLIYDSAGVDNDGNHYIEFSGGTRLCGDVSGDSGHEACGGNTFNVRIVCIDCPTVPVDCCTLDRPEGIDTTLYVTLGGGYGSVTLTWDGTYWSGGSFVVTAGAECTAETTVHLRYTTGCMLQYMCGSSGLWNDAGFILFITIDCGPPFIASGYEIFGSSTKLGCTCTTGISAIVTE